MRTFAPRHPSLESRSKIQRYSLEKDHANLLSAGLFYLATHSSRHGADGHIGKNSLTCAMRPTMELNTLESSRASCFKFEPTIAEFEKDNLVKLVASLPIGVAMSSNAILSGSRIEST